MRHCIHLQRLVHALIRNLIAFQSSYLVFCTYLPPRNGSRTQPVFVCRVQTVGSAEGRAHRHVPRAEIGINSHMVGASQVRHC